MSYLVINGGNQLSGTIQNQTSKNSAEAIICAALMIPGKVSIRDVPQIESVNRILELLESIGVSVERTKNHGLILDASKPLKLTSMNRRAAELARTSLLLMGALASRARTYKLFRSGGCHLGERTVRPHLYALKKLGVNITTHDGYYSVQNQAIRRGAKVVMYESGDTTTENAIMAAVLAKGTTTIKMASANYMVQDLCYFLLAAGAKISGIGTTTLVIEGVKELVPVAGYSIMPDPIAAMTFIAAGIVTGSKLTIANCPLDFLELELEKLSVLGQKITFKNERKSANGFFDIVDIQISPSQLKSLPDKIYGRPFPGLNIDNLVLFIPILTQAVGRTLVHDWAYEIRAIYSLELQKLGAQITLLDPHRVWVEGKTELVGNEIICPPALRPAVNVLICMLAATGRSILRNTYVIERGYEHLYETLNSVGADITVHQE